MFLGLLSTGIWHILLGHLKSRDLVFRVNTQQALSSVWVLSNENNLGHLNRPYEATVAVPESLPSCYDQGFFGTEF